MWIGLLHSSPVLPTLPSWLGKLNFGDGCVHWSIALGEAAAKAVTEDKTAD
jgi:hypothetical protein